MSDFIVLIHSDGDGNPVVDGPHGHWVVVTDDTDPEPVNQLSAGGEFPHADCGEACVKSILASSHGKPEAIVTIEHDANAGDQGTTAAQLQKALGDYGVKSTLTHTYPAKDTPPFRTIMNPLFGRIETGQQKMYEAAYHGDTIVVADSSLPPKPKPVLEAARVNVLVARFDVIPRHASGSLPIHTGPNSADTTKGFEPNNVRTVCDAWTYGNEQIDPKTDKEDARWYRIYNNGGWIASAFVDGNAPNTTPLPVEKPVVKAVVKPAVVTPKPAVVAPKSASKPVVEPLVPVKVTVAPASKPVVTPLPFIDGTNSSDGFIARSAAPAEQIVNSAPAYSNESQDEPAEDEQLTGVLPKPNIPENA